MIIICHVENDVHVQLCVIEGSVWEFVGHTHDYNRQLVLSIVSVPSHDTIVGACGVNLIMLCCIHSRFQLWQDIQFSYYILVHFYIRSRD